MTIGVIIFSLQLKSKNYIFKNHISFTYMREPQWLPLTISSFSWGTKTHCFISYTLVISLNTVKTCGAKKIIYGSLCPVQSSRSPTQCQGNVDEPTSTDFFRYFLIDLQMVSCMLSPPTRPFILVLKMTIWAPLHRWFRRGWVLILSHHLTAIPVAHKQ